MKKYIKYIGMILGLSLFVGVLGAKLPSEDVQAAGARTSASADKGTAFDIKDVPAYVGNPYVEINDNVPFFTDEEIKTGISSWELYDPLDKLGRCGECFASVGIDLMPSAKRGEIGSVKPSGWCQEKYPKLINGNYLYNRCHLIGYQLSGENDNAKNLITGTRYMNVDGMLPFEEKVAAYVEDSSNHVLYRVTPIFDGNDLLARGVLMEGESVEDKGKSVKFCVFAYNVQPGVEINYADGSSKANGDDVSKCYGSTVIGGAKKPADKTKQETVEQQPAPAPAPAAGSYVLNTNTHKFHHPSCSSVGQMAAKNRQDVSMSRDEIIAAGYVPCKKCNP